MTQDLHYSVMLEESVTQLVTDPNGIYVDGTFGRGGHSRMVLAKLSDQGRLIAFDKDPEAVEEGRKLEEQDARFSIYHGSFAELEEGLKTLGVNVKIDGVLLDLGVSSPQLDTAERGFSFQREGPLDMRMNNQKGQTAAQWIEQAKEDDIAFVIKTFGEEKFAKRMAKALVEYRLHTPITTTKQFAKIVSDAHPRWEKGKNPATKAFQGVRIYINSELEDLQKVLDQSLNVLKVDGRLVVISFHSLEDRIVKRFFRSGAKGKDFPMHMPVTEEMLEKTLRLVGKAIKASTDEVDENIRSRSAVLRIAEKL